MTIAISVDGFIVRGSAPYEALKTAFENRTKVYLTVIEDEAAAIGKEKGKRYAVFVESLNFSYPSGDKLTFAAAVQPRVRNHHLHRGGGVIHEHIKSSCSKNRKVVKTVTLERDGAPSRSRS